MKHPAVYRAGSYTLYMRVVGSITTVEEDALAKAALSDLPERQRKRPTVAPLGGLER
jgi:hypothetical protein